jgi:hypothetical protein
VDRAKQDCRRHGSEDGASVAAGDIPETTSHSAIEPVLYGDETVHARSTS